ncbi:hypothetical protein Ancab_040002 [Ancistrocladus abbreviatus]
MQMAMLDAHALIFFRLTVPNRPFSISVHAIFLSVFLPLFYSTSPHRAMSGKSFANLDHQPLNKIMPPLTFLFLFPQILMIQIHRTQSAAPTLFYPYCPNTTATFAANSIYQKTLDNLLSSLASNATQPNGFYNATSGSSGGAETIYGIFLCRGDDTTDVCKTCVNTAVSDLTQKDCPRSKEAIIWYDECLVRYSNQSFFGQLDDQLVFHPGNTQNITGNVTELMQLLSDMLNALAVKAASGGSGEEVCGHGG